MRHHSSARADRDPDGVESTRRLLLLAAYEEIHRHGFRAASLANILAATGLTKGALYHHFANKQQLGYAVLDEVIVPELRARWIAPLRASGADTVSLLLDVVGSAEKALSDSDITLGCPLNNLAQEMSPVDEGFRERINGIFDEWRKVLADALARGKQREQVRADLDVQACAAFLVAALEGCMATAKTANDRQLLMQCGEGLLSYLESLRATNGPGDRTRGRSLDA